MFGAIILTFVITFLSMLVAFLYKDNKNKDSEKKRLLTENDGLQSRLNDSHTREQRRREAKAYDQGLYDGRGTDTLYRQCLKKYMSQDQPIVMINGEKED